MSRILISCVSGLIVLAVLTAPCLAEQPTVFGPTGLIRVPGAYTAPAGSMTFSGHISSDFQSLNMAAGVIDRLEVSAGWVDPDEGNSAAVLSGKYRLWGEQDRGWALALGIFDITNELNSSVFGTVEKTFQVGDTSVVGMAGFGEHNSLVDGFFAGAELFLGRDYRLMMEYDGNDFNAALHLPVKNKFDIGIGILSDSLYGSATYYLR